MHLLAAWCWLLYLSLLSTAGLLTRPITIKLTKKVSRNLNDMKKKRFNFFMIGFCFVKKTLQIIRKMKWLTFFPKAIFNYDWSTEMIICWETWLSSFSFRLLLRCTSLYTKSWMFDHRRHLCPRRRLRKRSNSL